MTKKKLAKKAAPAKAKPVKAAKHRPDWPKMFADKIADHEKRIVALEGGPEPGARVALPGEPPVAGPSVPMTPAVEENK